MKLQDVYYTQAIIPYYDYLNSLSEKQFEKRLAKLSKKKTTKKEGK